MVLVNGFQQLRRNAVVKLCLKLQPLAECHKHLYNIDNAGVLVEFLNGSGELGELIAETRCRVWVVAVVNAARVASTMATTVRKTAIGPNLTL